MDGKARHRIDNGKIRRKEKRVQKKQKKWKEEAGPNDVSDGL